MREAMGQSTEGLAGCREDSEACSECSGEGLGHRCFTMCFMILDASWLLSGDIGSRGGGKGD